MIAGLRSPVYHDFCFTFCELQSLGDYSDLSKALRAYIETTLISSNCMDDKLRFGFYFRLWHNHWRCSVAIQCPSALKSTSMDLFFYMLSKLSWFDLIYICYMASVFSCFFQFDLLEKLQFQRIMPSAVVKVGLWLTVPHHRGPCFVSDVFFVKKLVK